MQNNMNILFCGSFYLPELFDKIQNNKYVGNANDLLQKSYLKGLRSISDHIHAVTIPNVIAYPKKESKLYIPKYESSIAKIVCRSCSFLNIVFFKHIFRYRSIYKQIQPYINNVDYFIFYDFDMPFLRLAKYIKGISPNAKIVFIIPDLPSFTGAPQHIYGNIYGRWWNLCAEKSYQFIDMFIFCAENMHKYLGLKTPYKVIEGIYNTDAERVFSRSRTAYRRLVYAGAMNERNGVLKLLESFALISDGDIELVLCGDGELHDVIQRFAERDGRIKFFGNIPRDEVLKYERDAILLINPRSDIEEFTKYSFPSKTMEYFASGTPVIMFRLSGIPKEYYKYCFCFDAYTCEAMADSIQKVVNMPFNVLQSKGFAARRFILENKIPTIQVKKIFE